MLFKNTNVNKLYQAIIWACLACFGFNSLGYTCTADGESCMEFDPCYGVEMSLDHVFSEEHVKIKVGPGTTAHLLGTARKGYSGTRRIEATVVEVTDSRTRALNNFDGVFQPSAFLACQIPLDLKDKFENYKEHYRSSLKKGDTIYVQYKFTTAHIAEWKNLHYLYEDDVTIRRASWENGHYLYEDKTYQVYLNKGDDNVYHLHKNSKGESFGDVYDDCINGHDMLAFKK